MVLATMALSTGEEDNLESHMSIWAWTLAILSVIAFADRVLSSPVILVGKNLLLKFLKFFRFK